MRTNFFAASALATLLLAPWAASPAAAQCCDDHQMPAAAAAPMDHSQHGAAAAAMPCCADHKIPAAAPAKAAMPCCDQAKPAPAKTAMACCDGSDVAIAAAGLGLAAKPVVQTMAVTFRNPVRVGTVVLMGNYVIEHDDARMARGEPCTYIYDAADRRQPVVTFHCTHLERPATGEATVVLRPGRQYPLQELKEFQFAGDEAGHGAPAVR